MKKNTVIIVLSFILLTVISAVTTAGDIRAPPEPPFPPKNLTADGSNGYVILRWDPAESSSEHPVEKYNIYRGNSSGNETFYKSVDASITTYNDYNVEIGKTYYYYVTAVNDVGESVPSNEANATVEKGSSIPLPPQNFRAEQWNETEVYLKWDYTDMSVHIKFYKIYRNGIYLANTTLKSYVDREVDYHKTYTYYVTAVNTDGLESNPSNQIKVEWSKPYAPQNLKAEKNGDTVVLTWNPPSFTGHLKIKEYKIYVEDNGQWKLLGSTKDTTFQIQTSSLPSGNVRIKVAAVNDLGEGEGAEVVISNPSANLLPYVLLGVGIAAIILVIYILKRRKVKNE